MARRKPHSLLISLASLAAFGSVSLGISACSDAGSSNGAPAAAGNGAVSGGGATSNAGASTTGGGGMSGGTTSDGGVSGGGTAGATDGTAGSPAGGNVAMGGAGGVSAGAAGSAGTAGGNAGVGGTAGAAYHPCPTTGPCRVMPLGDSITDGCCGQNKDSMGASYRLELFHLSLLNNKNLTFVGSSTSGPKTAYNVPFPQSHEGHPGWTIADKPSPGPRDGLQDQVVGWLTKKPADTPHIVTLMIGTNDVDTNYDLPNAPKRLGTLVDTIITAAPNALVVLAQMVPTRKDDENARVRAFNDAMPALVKTRADAGKHVVLVDIYGAYVKNPNFKTALLANDLHPSDAGYAVMANVWWGAIADLLPAK